MGQVALILSKNHATNEGKTVGGNRCPLDPNRVKAVTVCALQVLIIAFQGEGLFIYFVTCLEILSPCCLASCTSMKIKSHKI